MGKAENLLGQRFGRLVVVERGENTKSGNAQWLCKCDCGNPELKLVVATRLKNGETRSCGCLQKEIASETHSKPNEYDWSRDCGVGFTSQPDSYGRYEFYFDKEDYDKIKNYTWGFNNDYLRDTKDRSIAMHQLILPTKDGYIPEHIHGSQTRNDNRKSNLRPATQTQNLMNTKIRTDNTSGVKGVHWRRDTNKWTATIWVNKKCISLGCFNKFEEAVRARKDAEEKYFGEFSYEKSQAM